MNAIKISAVVLVLAGILGLAYGGFSYTKETHMAKVGPLELTVDERKSVDVPVWAGAGAVLLGGLMLVMVARR